MPACGAQGDHPAPWGGGSGDGPRGGWCDGITKPGVELNPGVGLYALELELVYWLELYGGCGCWFW